MVRQADAMRPSRLAAVCAYALRCRRENLTPAPQLGRKRKLDWKALAQHIQENPDALLRERAQYFGVHTSAIGYAQKQMKLTRKKNAEI